MTDPAKCRYVGSHGPNAHCPACAPQIKSVTDPETGAVREFPYAPEKLQAEAPRTLGAALTTDAMYAARARFNARLAARPCCRSHGTTCPKCKARDHGAPMWRIRLRDLRDLIRAAW